MHLHSDLIGSLNKKAPSSAQILRRQPHILRVAVRRTAANQRRKRRTIPPPCAVISPLRLPTPFCSNSGARSCFAKHRQGSILRYVTAAAAAARREIARNLSKKKLPMSANSLAVRKIPGIVLLSHSQIYSTIAAGALNCRVREGNECFCSAMDTGKYKTKK